MKFVVALVSAGILLNAPPASGQANAPPSSANGDKQKADVAFDAGIKKLKAGDYAAACPLLAQSLSHDYGMATEFRLAECYEGLGKTSSAYDSYASVAKNARAKDLIDRAELAEQRQKELEPELMRIQVVLPDDAADVAIRVHQGDVELPPMQWDEPRAVDPGTYRIVVAMLDHPPFEQSITLKTKGEIRTIHVVFADLSTPESIPRATPPPPSAAPSGQAIAGLVVGGIGVAGLGAGAVMGFVAKSKHNDSAEFCDGDQCFDEGLAIRQDARSMGTAATIVFVAGAALTVGGAVLWFTAPTDTTTVGVAGSGLRLRHRF